MFVRFLCISIAKVRANRKRYVNEVSSLNHPCVGCVCSQACSNHAARETDLSPRAEPYMALAESSRVQSGAGLKAVTSDSHLHIQ